MFEDDGDEKLESEDGCNNSEDGRRSATQYWPCQANVRDESSNTGFTWRARQRSKSAKCKKVESSNFSRLTEVVTEKKKIDTEIRIRQKLLICKKVFYPTKKNLC